MYVSNQSILKEIKPEYSLEGLLLKLKLQYFGHLMWRAKSLEKTLMLGKIEDKRRRRQQRMRWLDSITDSLDMNLHKLQEIVKDREPGVLQSMGSQIVGLDLGTEKPSVQFSCSVISDSWRLHWQQHARLLCPSPTLRACSNSCPSNQWCHPTIWSSVIPFTSCLQSFPVSRSFPMSQLFASGSQSIGALASASVLPMNI